MLDCLPDGGWAFYEAQAFIYIIIINTLFNYVLEISNTIAIASCIKLQTFKCEPNIVFPFNEKKRKKNSELGTFKFFFQINLNKCILKELYILPIKRIF